MIKNTSIILVLNIFLFSGTANAENAGADAQDVTDATSISDTKDIAQSEIDSLPLEKPATSNEGSAGTEKPGQKESTNLPADSTFGETERDATREMIAKERAAREMDAWVRAAKAEAAREMAARVSAARAEAAREMSARVRAAQEEAAREMSARVRAAQEEAAREMAARVRAAQEEAAKEMAAREKERAARERYYRERMGRY